MRTWTLLLSRGPYRGDVCARRACETRAGMSFETAATVFGAVLMGGALLSGIARRSFLSLTAIFVLVGFALGHGGLEVLDFSATSRFVEDLALVALVVILFRDGLEVEAEMLQTAWHVPLRKLVVAMPITAAIVALAAHAVTGLSWTESFLLGALLSPTDPVLSSTVVTNPRVPRLVRHSLNLESGLNDGLALPPVLALSAALAVGGGDFTWWTFVLQDVGLGLAFGLAIGFGASLLLPRDRGLDEGIPPHQRSLYALGVAFLTYGTTVIDPHGNGLIAVFVCAIVLGIRRPDIRVSFEGRAEDIVEIVKVGIFVVFGSLLTFGGLFDDGLAAVAIVVVTLLVARPVAVWIALAGTGLDTATKGFMAWFGPKGVATMTFSLLVLADHLAAGEQIFNLAALVVLCSIVAHGLSDHPGAEWIARRAATPAAAPRPRRPASGRSAGRERPRGAPR
jgi:NhaP-type Na+/H+ or K+/H+ antiporter